MLRRSPQLPHSGCAALPATARHSLLRTRTQAAPDQQGLNPLGHTLTSQLSPYETAGRRLQQLVVDTKWWEH